MHHWELQEPVGTTSDSAAYLIELVNATTDSVISIKVPMRGAGYDANERLNQELVRRFASEVQRSAQKVFEDPGYHNILET